MKPGKHQRSKQRCQGLGFKVHDLAESFVFRSWLCMINVSKRLRNVTTLRSKQLVCFIHGQGRKREQKTYYKEICQVS